MRGWMEGRSGMIEGKYERFGRKEGISRMEGMRMWMEVRKETNKSIFSHI